MNTQEVIDHYGTITGLARALRVARPTVYKWLKDGIPEQYQALIEIQTSGHFKLDRRKVWRNYANQ